MDRTSAFVKSSERLEWTAPALVLIGDAEDITNLSGANVENVTTSDS